MRQLPGPQAHGPAAVQGTHRMLAFSSAPGAAQALPSVPVSPAQRVPGGHPEPAGAATRAQSGQQRSQLSSKYLHSHSLVSPGLPRGHQAGPGQRWTHMLTIWGMLPGTSQVGGTEPVRRASVSPWQPECADSTAPRRRCGTRERVVPQVPAASSVGAFALQGQLARLGRAGQARRTGSAASGRRQRWPCPTTLGVCHSTRCW